jgi:type IV secretion system protein VirB10
MSETFADDGAAVHGPEWDESLTDADPELPAPARRFNTDPEDLALRAAPQPIVRFRKGLLVGAAAATLVLLAGVSWIALDPKGLQLAAGEQDLAPALAETAPEALDGLPQVYSAESVPQLGQPLPGDLGRPILAHEREMAQAAPLGPTPAAEPDPADQIAAAERQRQLTELTQARSAPVFMQVSRSAAVSSVDLAGEAETNTPPSPGTSPTDASNPHRLRPPASRWQVSAGSTIAASLITGLNSDLPGLVVAQVTEPVFDSATGRAILIPQGSRLLGRYESKVAFGQRRAMLVWDRLVMPNGASIALDNAPATDAAGYAGLSDRVDFHTWQLLKGIGFSTLLGVGTELTFGGAESDLVRALRESVQSNADRAGQKIVERNLEVAPTITVRPGFPVRVLIHKDLVLPPWTG